MNLVTERWIPVTMPEGTHRLASLLEVFSPTYQFVDLAVRPHERIALMRLLICIGQAALDGPNDIHAWDKAPDELPKAAERYLEEWVNCFELYYDSSDEKKKFPFLQITNLEKPSKPKSKEGKMRKSQKPTGENLSKGERGETFASIGKLDFSLASGANTTLFDHHGAREVKRSFFAYQIPLMLITFQNFSPGGTIGVGLWNGKPTNGWTSYPNVKPGQSSHAPCLPKNMLHAFIRQGTVFQTICSNLLTKKGISKHFKKPIHECWGKPIWEDFPADPGNQTPIRTYLGRLVPLSRGIRLLPNGTELLLTNGLEYPTYGNKKSPFWREVTSTEVHNKDKTERILLSASMDKAIWRELSALVVSREGEDVGGALSLSNIAEDKDYDLWVGALIADKASILDTVESVLPVPANMRTDSGRKAYDQEVRWAEKVENNLKSAVREYRKQFDGEFSKIDDTDLPKNKKLKLEQKIQAIALSIATRYYWTAVEKLRPLLMDHIRAIGTTAEAVEVTQKQWRKSVRTAAYESYRLACGQETPRQIRAFALGWGKLVSKPKDQETGQNADSENLEPDEVEV